jgi:hypothetical protein
MFSLFKTKETATVENGIVKIKDAIMPRPTSEIIAEIHDTFYTEVDRLLLESEQLNSLETTKSALIEKHDRLVKLGFRSTKECEEAMVEIGRLRNLESENFSKKRLTEAINYFSFKYPHYKFITEESVRKICEKYNLIYGPVNKYIGTVPDKNLKHIEDFKINPEDSCYQEYTFSYYNNRIHFLMYTSQDMHLAKKERETSFSTIRHSSSMYEDRLEECPLEIAAPLKDFDTLGMDVKNFKLGPMEIPDPIVLKPVYYKGSKHYLIVTAWGDEAADSLVVNERNN